MEINIFIALFTILASLVLSIFVLFRNKGNKVRISFFLLIVSITIWIFCNSLVDTSDDIQSALIWSRLVLIGPVLIPLMLVYFSLFFTKIYLKKYYLFILSIPAIVLLFLIPTKYFVEYVEILDWGVNFNYGIVFYFFGFYFLSYSIAAFTLLIRAFKKARGTWKTQILYVFTGLVVSALIASLTNIFLPIINVQQLYVLGPPSALIYLSFTTYAIVKHRLLDIKLVLLRTITYSIVVLLISATVVVLTLLIPESFDVSTTTKTVIAVLVSIFIVLILDPLKKGIAKFTDQLFFKAKVDYQKLLAELSETINREIDLDILLFSMSRKLEKKLKIKNVSIYLSGPVGGAFYKRMGRVDKQGKKVNEKEIEKLSEEEKQDIAHRIHHDSTLVEYMRKSKNVVVMESLERKIEDTQDETARNIMEESRAELDKMDAAVMAPIIVGDSLNAVMVLGPKLSGDPFGSEDLELLQLIGPQLASALEKSRLYEEAQRFTERLKKEVAMATEHLRNTNIQLQERNMFLSALQKVTTEMTRTLDFTKVTQTIANSINTELGYIGGIVLFLGKDRHKIFADAITQNKMTSRVLQLMPKPLSEYFGDFQKDKSSTITAMKTGKEVIGTDLADFISPAVPADIARKIQAFLKVKAAIAVPIFSEKEVVGAIVYLLDKEPKAFKETDLSMMKALTDQSGIVYRNIQLFERLKASNNELAEANKHLQQLDQAKSEFVSITSHQLRTPMTGIMGYLSMILQGDFGKVPEELNKILKNLLDESQRMIRLINLFLNVSKIESGKLELNITKVQIEDVVSKVIDMVKKAADDKGVKLIYKKPPKPLPKIDGDNDKLGDMILNLTDNAIKYTDKGSVTVATEVDGDYLHFAVKDTGRGIKPEEAEKLFTKFVRGFGIAQVNPDGSGLGLYVARRLTEAHHGEIWVDSEGEGKGSTFNFKVPIVRKDNN